MIHHTEYFIFQLLLLIPHVYIYACDNYHFSQNPWKVGYFHWIMINHGKWHLTSTFQVVGGMTWCITTCNIDIDVDLLFQENSTIGQKMWALRKFFSNEIQIFDNFHDVSELHVCNTGIVIPKVDFIYTVQDVFEMIPSEIMQAFHTI